MSEKEETKKRRRYVSPAGVAKYCYLAEPSDKFNDAGVYSVKLVLPGAKGEELIENLSGDYEAALERGREEYGKEKAQTRAKYPFKENPFYEEELDDNGEKTGNYIFNFKMTASGVSKKTGKPWTRMPALFDASKNPIKRTSDLKIWGGSVMKIGFTVNPYGKVAIGYGMTLCLEAAQILELASGSGGNADDYGFGAEEGFTQGTDADGGQTETNDEEEF